MTLGVTKNWIWKKPQKFIEQSRMIVATVVMSGINLWRPLGSSKYVVLIFFMYSQGDLFLPFNISPFGPRTETARRWYRSALWFYDPE